MGLSAHSDKTEEEWKSLKSLNRGHLHAYAKMPKILRSSPEATSFTAPEEVDWRKKGVVTPVKNQQACGSCWAFSAAETVESAYAMATLQTTGTPERILLAPQQLVDCAPNPDECGGTGGCAGSTQPLAFSYLIGSGGLAQEADYPYTARDGTCRNGKVAPAIGITGQVDLPTNNYTALMHALVSAGPIAISVDASWSDYEEGVYQPAAAGIHTTINHAVQLVGYGTDKGLDYWIVRNSWGDGWGESGYIRLQRFGEGKEPCGIDKDPADGYGCKGGPSSVEVCGTSGMLSASSYPLGAHRVVPL